MHRLWSSSNLVIVASIDEKGRLVSREDGGAEPDLTIPLTTSQVLFLFLRVELLLGCWTTVKTFDIKPSWLAMFAATVSNGGEFVLSEMCTDSVTLVMLLLLLLLDTVLLLSLVVVVVVVL